MQNKKPSVGGVWIFSGTAQFISNHSNFHHLNDYFIFYYKHADLISMHSIYVVCLIVWLFLFFFFSKT